MLLLQRRRLSSAPAPREARSLKELQRAVAALGLLAAGEEETADHHRRDDDTFLVAMMRLYHYWDRRYREKGEKVLSEGTAQFGEAGASWSPPWTRSPLPRAQSSSIWVLDLLSRTKMMLLPKEEKLHHHLQHSERTRDHPQLLWLTSRIPARWKCNCCYPAKSRTPELEVQDQRRSRQRRSRKRPRGGSREP